MSVDREKPKLGSCNFNQRIVSGIRNTNSTDRVAGPEQKRLQRLKSRDEELTREETNLEVAAIFLVGPEMARKAYELGKQRRANRQSEIGVQRILADWERKDKLIEDQSRDPSQILRTEFNQDGEELGRMLRRRRAIKEHRRRIGE